MDENKLLYAESHEWALIEGDTCTVGITRYAVEQLTDIVYVELPDVGKQFAAGDSFGVIESVKAVSDLYAPVAGVVSEVNNTVADDPALLSDDPYTKGWLVKLKLSGEPDVSGLKDKKAYDEQVAGEAH
jgi:glycine cleavage system H protein